MHRIHCKVRCHVSLLRMFADSHFSTFKSTTTKKKTHREICEVVSAGINPAGCQERHLSPGSGKVLMLQSVKRHSQYRGLRL